MREIKARGKAVMPIEQLDEMGFEHNNGWVVGNFIQNGKKPWIVGDIVESDPEYIVHDFWVRVQPESVGEYTGLKDKNGKEIYEGDVFREYDGFLWKVFWEDGSFKAFGGEYYVTEHLIEFSPDWCEVIGNIFENPELLKKDQHHD